MCFYEPPILLSSPDASAAFICAVPLAMYARRWPEAGSALVGLVVAFLLSHGFVIFWTFAVTETASARLDERLPALAMMSVLLLLEFGALFSLASGCRWLLNRGSHRSSNLSLIAVTMLTTAMLLALPETQAVRAQEITPINCPRPPLGDGLEGYSWLAAFCIFQILVAAGIASRLNRWAEIGASD
jgi:hypothetical protein